MRWGIAGSRATFWKRSLKEGKEEQSKVDPGIKRDSMVQHWEELLGIEKICKAKQKG